MRVESKEEHPRVLLLDVGLLYEDALSSWALRHGLGRVRREQGLPAAWPQTEFRLCITRVRGDEESEFERVRAIVKGLGPCPLVVLLENGGVDPAVRLVQLGVADVIELPANTEDLAARACSHYLHVEAARGTEELVGESPKIQELRKAIASAARVDSTVLLQGETGTGKGLVARAIHAASRRRDAPFVHVDCAALSPNLVESELFGHEKGAFTGAASLRQGRFEIANLGTIFLDEIGDLDAPLQSKLLRVLQERRYERVGGTRTLTMQGRVIAATSHDLLRSVQEQRFRQDLYFRLNVLKFTIPPLRERLSDVPLLVHAGLRRLSALLSVPVPRVSDEFYLHLSDYDWPGNVRELMNLLERLLVQRRVETLEVEDLGDLLEVRRTEVPAPSPVDRDDDAAMVRAALIDTGGNVSRAARRLGIARGTLRYRIRRFGLQYLLPKD